ncbi:MAG TPA: GntG family PLP-dependent aldolase [Actinomycetota bacterium]|nr:GntG family PLP-dependent aldolase [Actinomycetota bacterium]
MDIVELRSDTFTTPTPEMRRAMAEAEVGDDVWGEDPTAIALQERAAGIFGKEAGLFVPSGSMGNQMSIAAMTRPGDEVVCEAQSHIVLYEMGAPATIAQVMLRTIEAPDAILDPDAVAHTIRPASGHTTGTSLVSLENTHNARGGRIVPLDAMRAVAKVAHERNVAVFLDGARIFNAAVATGIPVRDWAADVDALSFCFSKGLGAPVGSMIVGTQEHIDRCRVLRKRYGGGMRQVGVLCAAARVALDTQIDRLADDHANARRLAEGWAEALPGCVDPATVETNMVFADLQGRDAASVAAALWERGVRVGPTGPSAIRAVTHRDVTAEGIEAAISAFSEAVRAS